jgi:hypothetical protein
VERGLIEGKLHRIEVRGDCKYFISLGLVNTKVVLNLRFKVLIKGDKICVMRGKSCVLSGNILNLSGQIRDLCSQLLGLSSQI